VADSSCALQGLVALAAVWGAASVCRTLRVEQDPAVAAMEALRVSAGQLQREHEQIVV
jgi:hypothetical protein